MFSITSLSVLVAPSSCLNFGTGLDNERAQRDRKMIAQKVDDEEALVSGPQLGGAEDHLDKPIRRVK